MGMYIDMEMPKPGEVIRIYNNGEARRCHVTEQEAFEVGVAFPVPPHGRLIDKDAIQKKCERGECPNMYIDPNEIVAEFYAAPTIIPASEEGEV